MTENVRYGEERIVMGNQVNDKLISVQNVKGPGCFSLSFEEKSNSHSLMFKDSDSILLTTDIV